MRWPVTLPAKGRSFPIALASFIVLQAVAALFFVADVTADLWTTALGAHSVLEALVTSVLLIGILLSVAQLRWTLREMEMQGRALEVASGDFVRFIERQFDSWSLTDAERDVGFLALKGCDIREIAELRGRAAGTIRAQLASIYSKANVAGHPQFVSHFVEELLSRAAERSQDQTEDQPKAAAS